MLLLGFWRPVWAEAAPYCTCTLACVGVDLPMQALSLPARGDRSVFSGRLRPLTSLHAAALFFQQAASC